MAIVREMDQCAWREWVESRPPVVQELCQRLPPDRLYAMKEAGSRVTIHSYHEDGTVIVNVSGKFNAVTFERKVFGVKPDDLEECDLPDPNEPVGVVFTEKKDIEAYLERMRQDDE